MNNSESVTAFYDVMFSHNAENLNLLETTTMAAIESALANKDELSNKIKPLPVIQLKLLQLLDKPDAHYMEIADLINQDPTLAARVLQIVNSAQNSSGFVIKDLNTAVARLGITGIAEIASSLMMKTIQPPKPIYYKMYGKQIWTHSLHTAYLCKGFAAALEEEEFSGYFLGLIHDVGKIVVFDCLIDAIATSDIDDEPGSLEFREYITEASLEISAVVAKNWGLPANFVEALEQQSTAVTTPLAVSLRCANACAEEYLTQKPSPGEDYQLPILATHDQSFSAVWNSFLQQADDLSNLG
ncbi:MAG: HDOD domain-containing protein [Pseudohongiellaceae bacterium]